MIAIVQRVLEASVMVEGNIVGRIGPGMLVLAAVVKGDTDKDLEWTAGKLAGLRIFRDASGEKHFDRDVREIGGSILLVSNFTVAGATRQGRRPSLDRAAEPAVAEAMFAKFVDAVKRQNVPVETGKFAADMKVALVNDGPVTFILDSRRRDLSFGRMSLPILSYHPQPSEQDLVRFYHRTELHWNQQVAEEEGNLDVGTALFNPKLPEVTSVFDAAIPEGKTAADAIEEVDAFFAKRNSRCRQWVPNPSSSPQRTAMLVEHLTALGYVRGSYDILRLANGPIGPVQEVAGLTIIPARASYRHMRALATIAAAEWGRPQHGDALMLNIDDPHTDALMALKDGEPVAFVTVLSVGELGCVENLFVVESRRGQGIGRTMMSRALEICARSLFKHVFVGVDPAHDPAAKLYARLGFQKVGEFVSYTLPR